MRRTGWARALLFLIPAGCNNTVTVPDEPPPPTIEGLLLADSSRSTFRIVWPTWNSSQDGDTPISAESVSLTLAGPAGQAPLVPDPDSVGLFRAALPIQAGERYRLVGTVAGLRIHAETTVPSRFRVESPIATIHLPMPPPASVDFRWSSEGATAYFARGARLDLISSAQGAARDTAGSVYFDPMPGASSIHYTLFAVNLDADQYLFAFPAGRSNIEGGFGYLGGAIAVGRVVRW